MPPKFLLKFNAAVIKEIPIPESVKLLTIGRKPDNDIVIDNPAISGHHCKVTKFGNVYFVEDLGSTNGTYIKGKKIIKAEIHHNDQIDLAKHSLQFFYEEELKEQGPADKTVVLNSEAQKEILERYAQSAQPASSPLPIPDIPSTDKTAYLKVVDGVVDKTEIDITTIVTYIGTTDAAAIKYKPGSGIFAGGAPEIAGLINKRPEGYILKALKSGFPKVNSQPVKDQILLKEWDVIEVGKTKLILLSKDRT
ncbi:MAG: FHA domain-containing protein [Elusimicrobia bacterium]|nr:FHA domain-containing protein [Elusimicrobiota bacterium]MBU2615297.1 FHA domain-containing protein [Elusimicrobiota bacterium]